MAARTFTAEFKGSPIELRAVPHISGHGRTTIWQASDDEGTPIGYLVGPSCNGWRFKHPEKVASYSPGTIAITTTIPAEGTYGFGLQSAVGATIIPRDYPKIKNIQEAPTRCPNWVYNTLLGSVRRSVTSPYHDGHVTEAEAWNQAVVLPAAMRNLDVDITMSDLRRALQEAGWMLGRRQATWVRTQ
jgi:hypothetical protein